MTLTPPRLIPTLEERLAQALRPTPNGSAGPQPDPNVVDGATFILGTSWSPIDLTAALNGESDIEPASILARTDGACLLYPGRVHWFYGEPESLKTWAALAAIAQTLAKGGSAGFIDFEDDERGFVARLRSLGVKIDDAYNADRLVYLHPEEPLNDRHGVPTAAHFHFDEERVVQRDLWVIDGVNVGMMFEGLLYTDNADIARWIRRIPRPLAATGAAVICLDHVTKDKEGRGRYAIGGQEKLASINGAAYSFDVLRRLYRATSEPVEAAVRITVQKDRPGHVRTNAVGDIIATLQATSFPDGGLTVALATPETSTTPPVHLIRRILEHLATYDGVSQRNIEEAVEGNASTIRSVLKWMVAEPRAWIRVEPKGRSHLHWLTDEGRNELS